MYVCSLYYDWMLEDSETAGHNRKYLFLVVYSLTFLFRYTFVLYVCMYVCMYGCTVWNISSTLICKIWWTYVCIHVVFWSEHPCIYYCPYIHTYIRFIQYIHTYIHTYIHIYSNFGPNTTTFVIPGEIYPPEVKATCHGISAAFGKVCTACMYVRVYVKCYTVRMYVYTYVCMFVSMIVCMNFIASRPLVLCMYVCMYLFQHMYKCMILRVCIYVCMYVWPSSWGLLPGHVFSRWCSGQEVRLLST